MHSRCGGCPFFWGTRYSDFHPESRPFEYWNPWFWGTPHFRKPPYRVIWRCPKIGVAEKKKTSSLKGLSLLNQPFWGYHHLWKPPHMSPSCIIRQTRLRCLTQTQGVKMKGKRKTCQDHDPFLKFLCGWIVPYLYTARIRKKKHAVYTPIPDGFCLRNACTMSKNKRFAQFQCVGSCP